MVTHAMARTFVLADLIILFFAISVLNFPKISRHEQFIVCWNSLISKDKNKRCKNLKIQVLKGKGYYGRQLTKIVIQSHKI